MILRRASRAATRKSSRRATSFSLRTWAAPTAHSLTAPCAWLRAGRMSWLAATNSNSVKPHSNSSFHNEGNRTGIGRLETALQRVLARLHTDAAGPRPDSGAGCLYQTTLRVYSGRERHRGYRLSGVGRCDLFQLHIFLHATRSEFRQTLYRRSCGEN